MIQRPSLLILVLCGHCQCRVLLTIHAFRQQMSLCMISFQPIQCTGVKPLLRLLLDRRPCICILITLEIELHIVLFLLRVDEVSQLAELHNSQNAQDERPEEGLNRSDQQLEAPVYKPKSNHIHNDQRN